MTRRVIFLDIDGVLAPIRRWDRYGDIEPACMDVLNEIVAVSGADIVVTSTHRHGKTVAELHEFAARGGARGPRCRQDTNGPARGRPGTRSRPGSTRIPWPAT